MTANTISSNGTGTLPVSGPGAISTVTVTDANVGSTDKVFLTKTSAVNDQRGSFGMYVSEVGSGDFTVTCDREQLPTALTFDYIVVQTA